MNTTSFQFIKSLFFAAVFFFLPVVPVVATDYRSVGRVCGDADIIFSGMVTKAEFACKGLRCKSSYYTAEPVEYYFVGNSARVKNSRKPGSSTIRFISSARISVGDHAVFFLASLMPGQKQVLASYDGAPVTFPVPEGFKYIAPEDGVFIKNRYGDRKSVV